MPIYRHIQPLINVTTPSNLAQTGTIYLILPMEGIGDESDQDFRAFIDATQSGGASSPTTDVFIQTSGNGTNWINVANMTRLTATGEQHEFVSIGHLGPYIRVISVLAGGTLPNHTVTVKLASDRSFRLRVAS